MKQATKKIIDKFSILENYLSSTEVKPLSNLNETERAFLQLAKFFEEPKQNSFDLQTLYTNLSDDYLTFALEVITLFFNKDTYLIKDTQNFSIIKSAESYLNQSQFADFLSDNGLNYDRVKLHMYLKRGIIPKPNLIIGGTKYWEKGVCEAFLNSQIEKTKDNYS